MTSAKQVAANGKNAKKSTGPKSSSGKALVAKNALKHGLFSNVVVLPNEEEHVFNRFKRDMVESLDPKSAREAFLVDRIVSCAWRLRRIMQIENFYMQDEIVIDSYRRPVALVAEIFRTRGDLMSNLSRYEVTIERSMYKAWDELKRLKGCAGNSSDIENLKPG